MNSLLADQLEKLKGALLTLKATGAMGFEGLIGTALREISGVPFRLAGGGLQFGIDGDSTYDTDGICFEGKRYDGNVPRNEVLSKLAELSLRNSATDLWVLGASSQIRSQLADAARAIGQKDGVFVLILDWSDSDLPPLAVALAMGGTRVEDFLKGALEQEARCSEALLALAAVRNSNDFKAHAAKIRSLCTAPTVGLLLAERNNAAWLVDAFSDRRKAKIKLGQPLSPGITDTYVRQRELLVADLRPFFSEAPDERVVLVLGGEGQGKSWAVAQSWLSLERRPLMIVISADAFAETAHQNDIVELLVGALIRQTGDENSDPSRRRWRRRFGHWRNHTETENPRLIVVIDGINQRPSTQWARIIEAMNHELCTLGGRLLVTSRTPYFRDRVKGGLSLPFDEIHVPEWSPSERDEILAQIGIKAADLYPRVAESLRNPRLLGIAMELADKADVASFAELSVSRLLFEHIRTSERDLSLSQTAHDFAHRLQEHGHEMLSRVAASQQDDLAIFEADVRAVADGRFFHSVDGDPALYELRDDGLTLALGFSMTDRLRTALRNERSLDAELEAILEPIAALDDTADVMLAALTVSAVGENYEEIIAASLVKGFAALQNPDQAKFDVFLGLAARRPAAFMEAARDLCLGGEHQPNSDWVEVALMGARDQERTWLEMSAMVQSWLSVYSTSPDLSALVRSQQELPEAVEAKRQEKRQEIKDKLYSLSKGEQSVLDGLQLTEGSLSSLTRLALMLLSGKKLESFAESLLNWSFSTALNSDPWAPYDNFYNLVRLNRVDWAKTRAALLRTAAELRKPNVSPTGKWALAYVLRATGSSNDSSDAKILVEELTKDSPSYGPRRLLEKYCETDPCDPASEQPENLILTAERYAALDASKLMVGMDPSAEGNFFRDARPAMARFLPTAATTKHREFAAQVLMREGFSLRQGLFELRVHNALLTPTDAQTLLEKRRTLTATGDFAGLDKRDAWIVSQYLLLLAFPFLSARQQIDALMEGSTDEHVLLDLMDVTSPLDETYFEALLEAACRDERERDQYVLLEMARHVSASLSARARARIAKLVRSDSQQVRAGALGVIAYSEDEKLLDQLAAGRWKAHREVQGNEYENWYGSAALLEAAARGLLSENDALDRICPSFYGRAATMLSTDGVREIARRVDRSIRKAVELQSDLVAPDIELAVENDAAQEPNLFNVSERPSYSETPADVLKRLTQSSEEYDRRQEQAHESFLEFESTLTRAKAHIILDDLSLREFEAIVTSDETFAGQWCELFMNVADSKLAALHNLILLLAQAMARIDVAKAQSLFRRVQNAEPIVRITFGRAGVTLDMMASWAGPHDPILAEVRFARLDQASTDLDLSLEVLAASLSQQGELLEMYVDDRLGREEPAHVARAIMVAGFSDQSPFNDNVIATYSDTAGMIGSAQDAAKYAYERNIWARHWFGRMCEAGDGEAFWRFAVLFSKIVDGRFSLWRGSFEKSSAALEAFGPSIEDLPGRRIKRWADHRKKTLFGSKAPSPIYLQP